MTALRIFFALAFGGACAYTVLGYPARYGALTGRSRLFRAVGLFLIDLLLGLVWLGTFLDFGYQTNRLAADVRSLTYALACLFLALTVACIALLDWLESLVAYRREQRDLVRRIVREEGEQAEQEEAETRKKGG